MGTSKRKAKALLTGFINEIALEKHSDPIVKRPGIDGADIVTKAEALARHIWRAALGYKEEIDIVDKSTGTITKVDKIHFPDKTYVQMVYERMEGRVPTVEVKEADSHASVADKVTKQGKNRLNSIAKR